MSLRNFPSTNPNPEISAPKINQTKSESLKPTNISKVESLDVNNLSSTNPTLYDKWNIFRFVMTNPKDNKNLSIDLRKYRTREDGKMEYCNEVASYVLSTEDPVVKNAINTLIEQAIKKGIELQYFK